MTQKEQGRLQTFNQVLEGWIGIREAAYIPGLSERHTWRLLTASTWHFSVPCISSSSLRAVFIPIVTNAVKDG